MFRYLKLYASFMRFSISRTMEFRFDLSFRIAMDTVFYLVNIAGIKLIYLQTTALGGWREDQAFLFMSVFFVIDAIYMTLFSVNIWWMPILINKGDLDYYLLRPVSSLFFLTLREFSPTSFINFIIATGILIWSFYSYRSPINAWDVLLLSFNILLGTLIYAAVNILFVIPVFWTHSGRGLATLGYSLMRFIERPDRIFTGVVRMMLVTVLPFSLIASFPSRLFIEGFDWQVMLHLLVVSAMSFLLILFLWVRGLRAYSSASS